MTIHEGLGAIFARFALEPLLAPPGLASSWAPLLAASGDKAAAFEDEGEEARPGVQLESIGDGLVRLQLRGVMMRKPSAYESWRFGAVDSGALSQAARAALAEPSIRGMLLDVDSPGGFLMGGPELASSMLALSQAKPVVAYTSGHMASLAYWVGSQARAVLASPSAAVGSIGVIVTLHDFSAMLAAFGVKVETFTNKEAAYKSIGVFGKSLSDAQRDYVQGAVDDAFAQFREAILSRRVVAKEAMQGQVLSGQKAIASGLVNGLASYDEAVGVLRGLVQAEGNAANKGNMRTLDELITSFTALSSTVEAHGATLKSLTGLPEAIVSIGEKQEAIGKELAGITARLAGLDAVAAKLEATGTRLATLETAKTDTDRQIAAAVARLGIATTSSAATTQTQTARTPEAILDAYKVETDPVKAGALYVAWQKSVKELQNA